jgi:hypothetical protein
MLTDTLNACIIDMKTVKELETVSADTKKQANANYAFKQIVQELQTTTMALKNAVEIAGFKPSITIVNAMKGYLAACNKVVTGGAANASTNDFIRSESKKVTASITDEWADFYKKSTANVISLLETVRGIVPDSSKTTYAINKIRKASNWSISSDTYSSMMQGLGDADSILKDLDLDEDSEVLTFLKRVGEGSATILDLTAEILEWLRKEGIEDKLAISFSV